jgi:hypothetical protein
MSFLSSKTVANDHLAIRSCLLADPQLLALVVKFENLVSWWCWWLPSSYILPPKEVLRHLLQILCILLQWRHPCLTQVLVPVAVAVTTTTNNNVQALPPTYPAREVSSPMPAMRSFVESFPATNPVPSPVADQVSLADLVFSRLVLLASGSSLKISANPALEHILYRF